MIKILVLCILVTVALCAETDELERLKQTVSSLTDDLERLKQTFSSITQQMMMQQFYVEEKTRSDGDSGIKQIRGRGDGTRPYYTNTHTLRTFASIHDHGNNDRTVGLGEFVAVLNGLEFRTRHNDYRLFMPHRTRSVYHAVEPMPFPDVPPEVLAKQTLQEQIDELRMWFAAWSQQNHTVRDYRPYFKPIICYLEGAWTTNTKTIEEPFFSDRHQLDASSWFDMQQKIRFTSYTGAKSTLENFAYLPTKIMNIVNHTIPQFAQWNYRILCHPVKQDVPLKSFRVVDDFSSRMASKTTLNRHVTSRAARFTLNPSLNGGKFVDKAYSYGMMDKLMGEIPGKNNYIANISDSAFGTVAFDILDGTKVLNTGYYHRIYRGKRDAMGTSAVHRGFSDANLWVAGTTQPQVAPLEVEHCKRNRQCTTYKQRVSYAIPLEIIYLTPLCTWNPYNITYHDASTKRVVTDDERNGGYTADTAYNGSRSNLYYITPIEFFKDTTDANRDRADTTRGMVGVLDPNGAVRNTTASGTRTFLPSIPGIGTLRTRWPIAPVHVEGSPIYKELSALSDLVMNLDKHRYLMPNPPEIFKHHGNASTEYMEYELGPARRGPPHTHSFELFSDEIEILRAGGTVQLFTSTSNGHSHDITLNKPGHGLHVLGCDGLRDCRDSHPRFATRLNHDD